MLAKTVEYGSNRKKLLWSSGFTIGGAISASSGIGTILAYSLMDIDPEYKKSLLGIGISQFLSGVFLLGTALYLKNSYKLQDLAIRPNKIEKQNSN